MAAKSVPSSGSRRPFLLWIALWAALLWPALFNGGAFLFPDTATYIRGADAAIFKVTGGKTDWTAEFLKSYPHASGSAESGSDDAAATTTPEEDKVVLSGRSVYFGFFLYILDLIGGAWLIVVAQAGATAIALTLIARRLIGTEFSIPAIMLIATATCLSSAGFFTSLVMPDWLAPLAIAATALVLCSYAEMSRLERSVWFAVIVFACLSHSANILIVGSMLVAHALMTRSLKEWHRFFLVIAAVLLSICGEIAFGVAVKKTTGFAPVRPPFLSARIIEDGPGYRYLTHQCPVDDDLVVCQFLDRLPVHSDTFLWAVGDNGVFSASSSSTKRALAAQDLEVFVGTMDYDPQGFGLAMAENVKEQASKAGVEEFNGIITDHAKLTPSMLRHVERTRATMGTMPVETLGRIFLFLFLISAAALLIVPLFGQRVSAISPEMARFGGLVLVGIAIDVIVCGTMSTPHDRYLARVMWMAPFAAGLLAAMVINARVASHAPSSS